MVDEQAHARGQQPVGGIDGIDAARRRFMVGEHARELAGDQGIGHQPFGDGGQLVSTRGCTAIVSLPMRQVSRQASGVKPTSR